MATEFNSTLTATVSSYSGLPMDREVGSWLEFLFRLQMSDINHSASAIFIRRTWLVSVYASAIYIVLVFFGLNWMKNKQPFNLRYPLAIWSGALCVFSFLGTIAVWPEFVSLAWNTGIVATYCDNSYRDDNKLMYWYTVFVLSKLLELLDTAFIVLRKQKLITLHWVHHVLTLVYCFYVYRDQVSTARWMVAMNFAIHTVMYGYYALRALRVSIPRPFALVITTGQIVQMIFGFYINIHVLIFALSSTPEKCQCSLRASVSGFFLYALFFYYFVRFFVDAYLSKPKDAKQAMNLKSPPTSGSFEKHQISSNEKHLEHDLNNNDAHLMPKKVN